MENMSLINLRETELVETPAEGATLFCLNPDGTVNRVSAANVGGSGGIKTAIIKDSGYDNAIAGVQSASYSTPENTYECINMTFEEAYQLMANGEPLQALGMFTGEGGTCGCSGALAVNITSVFETPCIGMEWMVNELTLYWTAAGLSTTQPGA
ncbi:MAG: hypothetical protein IJ418_00635 [Clostridia bacterium]|nr:hypothetical protein [Clostridia bacterium]